MKLSVARVSQHRINNQRQRLKKSTRPGLEPGTGVPKTPVLPITPPGNRRWISSGDEVYSTHKVGRCAREQRASQGGDAVYDRYLLRLELVRRVRLSHCHLPGERPRTKGDQLLVGEFSGWGGAGQDKFCGAWIGGKSLVCGGNPGRMPFERGVASHRDAFGFP